MMRIITHRFQSSNSNTLTATVTRRLIHHNRCGCTRLQDGTTTPNTNTSSFVVHHYYGTSTMVAAPLTQRRRQQQHLPQPLRMTAASLRRCDFHSSAIMSFPIRRRRKVRNSLISPPTTTNEDDSDDGSSSQTARSGSSSDRIVDFDLFENESDKLLDKLYNAILPMKSKNDIFILERGHDRTAGPNVKVDLGPIIGTHYIDVNYSRFVVVYTSPVSGQFTYGLVKEENDSKKKDEGTSEFRWREVSDGHQLEGMVVRDLLKTANGCPKL